MLNNINKVLDEYKPDNSIWREYSDDVLMLKEAVSNLSDADRIIFVMYAEYGSLRKVKNLLIINKLNTHFFSIAIKIWKCYMIIFKVTE